MIRLIDRLDGLDIKVRRSLGGMTCVIGHQGKRIFFSNAEAQDRGECRENKDAEGAEDPAMRDLLRVPAPPYGGSPHVFLCDFAPLR